MVLRSGDAISRDLAWALADRQWQHRRMMHYVWAVLCDDVTWGVLLDGVTLRRPPSALPLGQECQPKLLLAVFAKSSTTVTWRP